MVVGGGFIGLEMAENLVHRGLEVTLVEMLDQVLAPLDPECARLVERHLEKHGVRLALGDGWPASSRLDGRRARGRRRSPARRYPADIVILAIGVRPETDAGEGGRARDRRARRHPRRRADAHQRPGHLRRRRRRRGQGLRHRRSGASIPLAGPANRQGRIAADVIAGRDSRFRGTQGTSIIGLFGATVAWTGASEKTLKRLGADGLREDLPLPELARRVLPGRQDDRAEGHLPQVRRARSSGRRRSATDGGREADQRPRHGDPDGRDGLRPRGGRALLRAAVRQRQGPGQLRRHGRRRRPARRHAARPLGRASTARSCSTCATRRSSPSEAVPGAVNIPLPQLRARLGELPRDREILVICRSAAARLLRDAHPAAERLQGQEHLRRHAGARDDRGG